jgi:hypothetical protein
MPEQGMVQGKFTIDGNPVDLKFVSVRAYEGLNYEEKVWNFTLVFLSDQKIPDSIWTPSESDTETALQMMVFESKAHIIVLKVDTDNSFISETIIYDNSLIGNGFALPSPRMTVEENIAKGKIKSTGKKAKYEYDVEFEAPVIPLTKGK